VRQWAGARKAQLGLVYLWDSGGAAGGIVPITPGQVNSTDRFGCFLWHLGGQPDGEHPEQSHRGGSRPYARRDPKHGIRHGGAVQHQRNPDVHRQSRRGDDAAAAYAFEETRLTPEPLSRL
jgi:hypothetical protein